MGFSGDGKDLPCLHICFTKRLSAHSAQPKKRAVWQMGGWNERGRVGTLTESCVELFRAGGQAPPLGKLAPCRESGNIYSQRYHHQQSQTVPALWEKGLQLRPWEMGHSQVLSRETRQFVLCLSRFVCSIGTPKAGLKQGPLKESTGAWQVARPLQKCSLAREQN